MGIFQTEVGIPMACSLHCSELFEGCNVRVSCLRLEHTLQRAWLAIVTLTTTNFDSESSFVKKNILDFLLNIVMFYFTFLIKESYKQVAVLNIISY